MRQPTLYTALPFYHNSVKHLTSKNDNGYGQLKGIRSRNDKIKPFQIRTISSFITSIALFEAKETNLLGQFSGNNYDLSNYIDQLDIKLLDNKAYIINNSLYASIPFIHYVLHISYANNNYYSELVTQFNSGVPYIPEISDNYIIDANLNTAIKFYDDSIMIISANNEGSASIDIVGNKIIVIEPGTIAGLSINDNIGNSYYFPCVENMHTIHCVLTGKRAIVNNYSWSINGTNNWNLLHGATKLTSSTGAVGFIPYTSNNEKLIVL